MLLNYADDIYVYCGVRIKNVVYFRPITSVSVPTEALIQNQKISPIYSIDSSPKNAYSFNMYSFILPHVDPNPYDCFERLLPEK